MVNVQFEENDLIQSFQRSDSAMKQSFLTRMVIKAKLAKDEAGVKKVFVAITVLCFSSAILIYFVGNRPVKTQVSNVPSPNVVR